MENKEYLILLTSEYGDRWDIVNSRKDAYEYIKNVFIDGDFPITEEYIGACYILVEDDQLKNRKNIIDFMEYCKKQYYPDDDFDINEYFNEEDGYNDGNGNIDGMFNNNDKLTMKEIMDGEFVYNNEKEVDTNE